MYHICEQLQKEDDRLWCTSVNVSKEQMCNGDKQWFLTLSGRWDEDHINFDCWINYCPFCGQKL